MILQRENCSRATYFGIATCFVAAIATSAASRADDTASLSDIRERSFRAEFDDSVQKYVIMTPLGFTHDEPTSLLIALHGHGSDRWQFIRQPRGECRATRDVATMYRMVLISPDYRATTSWMGPAAEADLLQIIRNLKGRFKVKRVVLCGGSMGGTAALTFAALHPNMIDAVVSLNGTANLVDYDRFQDAIAKSFGGTKQQVPHEYRKRSAEFFPKRFTMPIAATTGGKDATVPPESVLRLLDRVRDHNQDVLSLHRPDGGHSTTFEDTQRALEFVLAASEARSDDDE